MIVYGLKLIWYDRALVGEINTYIDSYNAEGADKKFVENTFEEHLEIDVEFIKIKNFLI